MSDKEKSEMHELALGYLDANIPVFPCREEVEEVADEDGVLRTKSDKTPRNGNGFRGATLFSRIVDRWWSDHPNALVGVPTGERSGFWVLDIDVPSRDHEDDGRIWLDEMADAGNELPVTKWAYTAGGGMHFFFKFIPGIYNKAGSSGIAAGVDVRGEGGYIIAPGSKMADGRFYEWADDTEVIADAPDWLLDLVVSKHEESSDKPREHRPIQRNDYQPTGDNPAYTKATLDREIDELSSMGKGGRGFALNKAAFKLGSLVAGGHLSRSEVEAALYSASVSNGLVATDGDREVMNKIRRGLGSGARKPRDPPPPDIQPRANTKLRDLTRMIEKGMRKGELSKDDAEEYEEEEQQDEEEFPIVATPWEWKDPTKLPRRDFVFDKHYIRRFVSVTVAPGGVGKTANSVVESLSMVTGKDLLNIKPHGKSRVWLFNAEDPLDELDKRIAAACLYYDITKADIGGRLFVDSGREQELCVAVEERKGVVIQVPIVESVVEQIRRNKIDVLIIDPFVSTHSVNENDNGAIDKVAKLWSQIADMTNSSIDIVHHLKKVGDREATVEDARGAVSLIGAARSVRVLSPMSEKQGKSANLSAAERGDLFSIQIGKANLSKKDNRLTWRKRASQSLGNGNPKAIIGSKGDDSPVVAPWKWPDQSEAAASEMTDGQVKTLLTRLRNGQFKIGRNGSTWAGLVVCDILALDMTSPDDRAKAENILSGLKAAGTIKHVSEKDPAARGKNANFVRPSDYESPDDAAD